MNKPRLIAIIMLLITVSSWGGMYHIAKAILPVIDAFWLALIRYSFTVFFFVHFFFGVKACKHCDSMESS